MSDYRIDKKVIKDNGSDGIFWRNRYRYIRGKGQESKLLDISPGLEQKFMDELETYPTLYPH